MKKSTVITLFYTALLLCLISCLFALHPYFTTIEASSFSQEEQLMTLHKNSQDLTQNLESLNSRLAVYGKSMNELEKRLSDLEEQNAALQNFLVDYYMDKLKDPTYVILHPNDSTYYIAAENLGLIGKPAIPALIERLNTKDDYERALALYALLLASQSEQVQAFCGNDYIHTNLDFDARNHPQQVNAALEWWEKYKDNF